MSNIGRYTKNSEPLSDAEKAALEGAPNPDSDSLPQDDLEALADQMNANAAAEEDADPAPAPAAAAEGDDDDGDGDPTPEPSPKTDRPALPGDEARAHIYAKSNRKEEETAAEEIKDLEDTIARYGRGPTEAAFEQAAKTDEGEGGEPAPAAASDDDPAAPAQPQQQIIEPTDDMYVRQVIDGKEQLVPIKDIVRNSQIDGAANARLQQATEMQREAMQLLRDARQGIGTVHPEPQAPTPDEEEEAAEGGDALTGQDREELIEIAETLQSGSTDELADALGKVLTRRGGKDVSPESVREAAREAAFLEAERQDSQAGVKAFEQEYEEITADPNLGAVYFQQINGELMNDIKALDASYTDEEINRVLSKPGNTLTTLYNNLKMNHPNRESMRTRQQIMLDAGAKTMEWRNGGKPQPKPTNDPHSIPRSERKEHLAPAPASRSRAPTQVAQTPMSEAEQRKAAVGQIRQSRGQSAA